MHRRAFLKTLALSVTALSNSPAFAAPPHRFSPPPNVYAAEAARLTEAVFGRWWSPEGRMFRASAAVAETVLSDPLHDHGCVFWPSLIAFHALIEGEKHEPGRYTDRIRMVYDGLEQYYSADLHAYSAWLHFPGNVDAYYDDNSWAVIVLVEAHLACRKTDPVRSTAYLARAKTIMAEYIIQGYDATNRPGGMRWGSDAAKPNTSDRGTSSTAGSALAALMLARAGVDAEFHTRWGHSLLTWLGGRLRDADGLVMDALSAPDWRVRKIKWTYNTGVPMRAYVEHYRLTGSTGSLTVASELAGAAIDRSKALFDQAVHDAAKRFYWDESYFVHYLLDGLIQVAQVTPDPGLAAAVRETIGRSADYAHTHLRDPADRLYWRNWRLYTIGKAQHTAWQEWTGQTISPEYDASERSQEARFLALPVQDRPLVKTLLASAGAARLFWLASRL